MGAKRKSGGGGPANAKASKLESDTSKYPHIQQICDWLKDCVVAAGGPDRYLTSKYSTKDAKMGFAQWLDQAFPADTRETYANDFGEGTKVLRPYHLSWRADFGLSSMIEPDVLVMLAEVILAEGFRTNPAIPGVECLAITQPDSAFLESKYVALPRVDSDVLPPFSVAYVKGWRRSVTCLAVADAIRTLNIDDSVLLPQYKESMRAVYATVGHYSHVQDQVLAARGISLTSALRRPPNCFNLLRQHEVLTRASVAAEAAAVWENAAEIAKVFRIGKAEAGAILNLTTKVQQDMVIKLRDAVRTRGMRAFINHDCIARDLFNLTFTTGTAALEPWASQLMNREDNKIVSLLIDRMCGDFDRQAPSMRKPWAFKDASSLHSACGAFLHFLQILQNQVSQADFQQREANLKQQFALGVFDPDLLHALENSVPPSSLDSVSFLRSLAAEISQKQARDVEERNRELADRVAAATMDQLRAKLEADMEELKKHVPSAEKDAIETALDMKYLQERQMKGQQHVQGWMQKNCRFVSGDPASMHTILRDFAQHRNDMALGEGTLYTIATLDATVFPSNALQMKEALETMSCLLNIGVQNIAHIQLPIPQSNTTPQALTKHRRTIEDYLLSVSAGSQAVGLHMIKPNDAHASDKRGCLQSCVAVYVDSKSLPWSLPILIGPVELVRVSDMLGYDEVNRPGVTARTEQKGVPVHIAIIEAYVKGLALKEEDKVIVFDVLPNRHAEFARAIVKRKLSGKAPDVSYFGIIKDTQKDVVSSIEEDVYNAWDNSSAAPAKTRVRDAAATPTLDTLSWVNGSPKFPDALLAKFPEGSLQHQEIVKFKEKVISMFPASANPSTTTVTARATGLPDYSGENVLDLERELSLETIGLDDFNQEELASCPGKAGKPSIMLTKDYVLWVGNVTEEEMLLTSGELFGFNLGAFEIKLVSSASHAETHALPWILTSDMQLVAYEKKAMPISMALCKIARERGLGEIGIWDHFCTPKLRNVDPAGGAAGGAAGEMTPVPYRYDVGIADEGKTNCFKPNPLTNVDKSNHKPASFGAVYLGQMGRVIKNKTASVLWEVQVQPGSATPKLMPVKPKVYLTASVKIPAKSWVKLGS